jgi:hypothetical protein
MGALNPFQTPKIPTPQIAPAPESVTREAKAEEIAAAQEEEKKRRATQRGRAATILSPRRGAVGDDSAGAGGLATKRLLGG